MNISVEWDDDTSKELIIVRYLQSYTWEELETASEAIYTMLRSVSHPVNMITVLNPNIISPRDGNILARFRTTLSRMPLNLGLYITVGQGNAFTRIFFNSVLKVYPTRFEMKAFGTEDEARAYLTKRGNSISE